MMMTTDKTYNGWSNYATWGVALVLGNDQGVDEMVREMGTASDPDWRYADQIRDLVESMCEVPDSPTSPGEGIFYPLMARQIIQAGLADVDWVEIARDYRDSMSEWGDND